MIVDRLYAETLNVEDLENYSTDPGRYLLVSLRRRFEGRCRKGAFVLRVAEVTERGRCRIKETDNSAEGYVDVVFRAEVSVLGQWDIVTGVFFSALSPLIYGRSEAEGALVVTVAPGAPGAALIQAGQVVPVRVHTVRYSPDQGQATAFAIPLACDQKAPAYALEGALTPGDAQALAPLAERARALLAERARLAAARPEDLRFFDSLLYSFPRLPDGAPPSRAETRGAAAWEGPPAHPLPPGAVAANLLDLLAEAEEGAVDVAGVWTRDPRIHRTAPLAARHPPGAGPPGAVGAPPRVAFAEMLRSAHEFLKGVNGMLADYPSLEEVERHRNVWQAMREAQLPPPPT